jgi:hypothetical protein
VRRIDEHDLHRGPFLEVRQSWALKRAEICPSTAFLVQALSRSR